MNTLKRKRADKRERVPELPLGPQKSSYVSGFKWVRGRMLGKGGFGSVYLASVTKRSLWFKRSPEVMAVKSTMASASTELVRERALLDCFRDCPFVIDCNGHDLTVGDGGCKIYNVFLEYASGGTMGDLIRRSGGFGLRESQVRKYTDSILQGLKYIHEKGYVHCDLKPENILLVANTDAASTCSGTTKFVPKIGDFGLAKSVFKKKGEKSCGIRGTAMYLSPEAVVHRIQEQPSDIWALGCVVLKMLTGKLPWKVNTGKNFQSFKHRIASGAPIIPSELSKEAQDFLGKCFVRNPSERSTAALLLSHPFVCKPDWDGHAEDLKEVSSLPSSNNCDHNCSSFIPLGSLRSEVAEEMEEHLGLTKHHILPLKIMYQRNTRTVIPNTVLPIMGAA